MKEKKVMVIRMEDGQQICFNCWDRVHSALIKPKTGWILGICDCCWDEYWNREKKK